VREFLLKRFLRIFLPFWPIALGLAAAYALLPASLRPPTLSK